MLRAGIFATLLLGSAFYFPIPGSNPCSAVVAQESAYLYSLGALTGFESETRAELTAEMEDRVRNVFAVSPARWTCAINYWRNEADPNRIDAYFRRDFKKLLLEKIQAETGQTPEISDETLNELYLEFLQKR